MQSLDEPSPCADGCLVDNLPSATSEPDPLLIEYLLETLGQIGVGVKLKDHADVLTEEFGSLPGDLVTAVQLISQGWKTTEVANLFEVKKQTLSLRIVKAARQMTCPC
jgi:hypothetical protein